jgi:hypothetical protein
VNTSKGGECDATKSHLIYEILYRTSEEEVVITRMLDKVLRRSDALDKESLCVVAGQRVSTTPGLSL